jgi:alpha/beta superfamily hydrolase
MVGAMNVGSALLTTTDGVSVEAEWAVPDGASAIAVLSHPHPMMGGDMTTPVPDALFRGLPERSIGALRFNFRGVGESGGRHGGGVEEVADVVAAIEQAGEVGGGATVWLAGYSFGADVSLQVADDRIGGWVLIAPTLRTVPPASMLAGDDDRPKHLLVPEHDQFCGPVDAEVFVSECDWRATTVSVVPGADHFLTGRLDVVVDAVASRI